MGDIYDGLSATVGYDLITGRSLSAVEKTIMLAGAFTIFDELASGVRLLNRALDQVDTARLVKAGKGVGRFEEAANIGRGVRNGLLKKAPHLDTLRGLTSLDQFSGRGRVLKQGNELRQAFAAKSQRGLKRSGNLSGRLNAAAAWRKTGTNLNDPSVRYMINRGLGPIRGGSGAPVRGPDGLGLLARYKWHRAGYDITNPQIRSLIREGHRPDKVIRLFRGQLEPHANTLSYAARTRLEQGASLEEAVEYSKRLFEGELAASFRAGKYLETAGIHPDPDLDDLTLLITAHKGEGYQDFPNPLIALTTDVNTAKRRAGDSGVILEVVIPRDKVISVEEIMGFDTEAEYVIPNYLPDDYIISQSFSGLPPIMGKFPRKTRAIDEFKNFEPGDLQGAWPNIDDLIPLHPADTPGLVDRYVELTKRQGFNLRASIPAIKVTDGRFIMFGGHHRKETLKQLGFTRVPVIYPTDRVFTSEEADAFLSGIR